MLIILLILILAMLILIFLKKEIILKKIKLFLKNYKILIIIEIIIIITIFIINIFNNTIIIKEIDPHSNKLLKFTIIQEGEIYSYFSEILNFKEIDEINTNNIWENANVFLHTNNRSESIVVKKVKISTVIIEKSGQEVEYNYGEGFSYYSATSCMCGTPIKFYKITYEAYKIIVLSVFIIDLIILCLVKENKPKGE